MTKKIALALVGLMVTGSLVACGAENSDGIDTGVVIERKRRVVVVLEDDGEKERHSIHKRSKRCPVGSRWPQCKNA